MGLVPGWGRFPWSTGNPLQYFCLENPMDRGAWWAPVHSVTKSWTRLKRPSRHAYMHQDTCRIRCSGNTADHCSALPVGSHCSPHLAPHSWRFTPWPRVSTHMCDRLHGGAEESGSLPPSSRWRAGHKPVSETTLSRPWFCSPFKIRFIPVDCVEAEAQELEQESRIWSQHGWRENQKSALESRQHLSF